MIQVGGRGTAAPGTGGRVIIYLKLMVGLKTKNEERGEGRGWKNGY